MATLKDTYPKAGILSKKELYAHAMGPGTLYLAEKIAERMELSPGMRLLDFGCGNAITSLFLTREYGVQVVAADKWVKPDENWGRVQKAGYTDKIMPIYFEAHNIPFAEEYFDRIFAMDSYHYVGTDDRYLRYVLRFLKKDGLLGIGGPCFTSEIDHDLPQHIEAEYRSDLSCLHSPDWWKQHLTKENLVETVYSEPLLDGFALWMDYLENISYKVGQSNGAKPQDPETIMILSDRGDHLTHHVLVVRKK